VQAFPNVSPNFSYVGTLHEINSETSTVALENVTSFGTEGRKNNPSEEIPPSDSVYEYIVFRGSDVKDLRIEEAPAAKENKPPQVPNDPAILGVSPLSLLLLSMHCTHRREWFE
jgi:protein LSM14